MRDAPGIVVIGPDHRVEAVSDAVIDLLGVPAQAMVGHALADFLAPPDGDPGTRAVVTGDLVVASERDAESGFRRIAAGPRAGAFILCQMTPMRDHFIEQERVVLLLHGLSGPRGEVDRGHQTEVRDRLTGLVGRQTFMDELDRLSGHARHLTVSAAVILVNLDGFHVVNEQFGHDAADAVLRELASRLGALSFAHDLVARLGGDEFGLIVPTSRPRDPALTDPIHAVIRHPVAVAGWQTHLSASIGQVVIPEDGTSAADLLVNAGLAMRVAKSAGGDRTALFTSNMNKEAERIASLRLELTTALRSDGFRLWYQPIVDVRTGACAAAEALIRLQRGAELVAAAEFIPVAERFGLLNPIGMAALHVAMADLQRLAIQVPTWTLPIALNLSPTQLLDEAAMSLLADWHAPGGRARITIEVTESFALVPGGPAIRALEELRTLGYRVAIDDFGSGYSSIALLEVLRPDSIKVDRTLLVAARSGGRGRRVFDATMHLLRTLEAGVTVEGVETEEDLQICRDAGADRVQGYLLGPAQPLESLLLATESDSAPDAGI